MSDSDLKGDQAETKTNGFATPDKLKKARKVRYLVVDETMIPELKDVGKFMFRSLTERQRALMERDSLTKSGAFNRAKLIQMRSRLLVWTWVHPDTKELQLDPKDEKSLEFWEDIDSTITAQLQGFVQEHVGMPDSDLEELVKNSEAMSAL